jgi:hypothetical protein
MTVSGWINIVAFKTPIPGLGAMNIIGKMYNDPAVGNNPTQGYQISQDFAEADISSFHVLVHSSTDIVVSNYLGFPYLPTNDWMFFAFVIDNRSMQFYHFYPHKSLIIDSTFPNDILPNGTQGDLVISYDRYFNGKIDDVAIYNRALARDEITQLYQQTMTKY